MPEITTGPHYLGFVLSDQAREKLMAKFKPGFPVVRCHHVTIKLFIMATEIDELQAFIDRNPKVFVTGFHQADGIDFYTATIDGQGKRHFLDGKYHVTFSHDALRKPTDANAVIKGEIEIFHSYMFSEPIELEGSYELISHTYKGQPVKKE